MGQVCFTAISSNCACHHSLHCSEFSVPDHVLCVRLSECSMAGVKFGGGGGVIGVRGVIGGGGVIGGCGGI